MFDTEGSAKAQEEKIGGAVREKWIETNLICRRLETIPEGFIAIRDRERPKKGGIGEKISPVVGSRQCFIRGKRDAKGWLHESEEVGFGWPYSSGFSERTLWASASLSMIGIFWGQCCSHRPQRVQLTASSESFMVMV
jgi:hypothetical protein